MKFIIFSLFALLMINTVAAKSLYDPESYTPLLSEHQSFAIGDIVTVMIYESSSATSQAGSKTSVSNSIGLKYKDDGSEIGGDFGISGKFDGGGSTVRNDEIAASISVNIISINANGDFNIEGQQILHLNTESRNIQIKGTVRPEDIASDNSIASTRISNAEIKFLGEGDLSSAEKPGLITKFWNFLF
ncbi:MAG: flagellar basal body L-ring protein FlgH [Saccharospirillaceae bacterium]|nr:flagellar basal body L-ring protein FlgH [Pseudomonadales bacterium]NRB79728.1 flagellar basal body L-ring protein FlgH [Saccharospirillaceae bacterium]